MRRRVLQLVVIAAVAVFGSMAAQAGWDHESFNVYTQGGSPPEGIVDYNVNFWLLSERYASHFTMYKVCGDMRIYVMVQKASYLAFKQQTVAWDVDDAEPLTPGDAYAGVGSPGTITWIDDELYDGDEINFNMWCPDFFRDHYGEPLQVSILVAPQPDRRYGLCPNVNVHINNGILAGLKVTYPRLPGVTALEGTVGEVTATCGWDIDRADFINGPIGWIGALHVGGGIIADETVAYQGLMDLIARGRRQPKLGGLLQGGTMDGTIVSGGRIGRIFTNNGLGTASANPQIGAGWQIALGDDGVDIPTPFGIGRVVMKRGGNGARVTAGSDPTASTRSKWAFQGSIKKIICKDKGGGANTGVTGCTFVSLETPKVITSTTIASSVVETPHASTPINTP